jgi:ubiquinone/menaquinone biosynthesis C-methylase UbiE
MWNELAGCIPNDHSGQVTPEWMVNRVKDKLPSNPVIADVGCGTGNSSDFFVKLFPGCTWVGIDIKESPEVRERRRSDVIFMEFDGINIPLPTESVDLVFNRHVLEHVRHPEALLKDVARVLKSGGFLVGSTSQLEPYHSYQYWNFTPFGFKQIANDAGIPLKEIRPSIDGLTLVRRTYEGRPKSYSVFFSTESPLNSEIDSWAKSTGRGIRQTVMRKLSVCGQFVFLCEKPAGQHSFISAPAGPDDDE